MNPSETRPSHPSSAQVETLVEFMERNLGMAKGFLRTQNARERSRRQWEELAVRLKSISGTIKTYKQWIKENYTPSPSHEVQQIQDADTHKINHNNSRVRHLQRNHQLLYLSSRHTSLIAALPPSQWRTEFSTTTEGFLRMEKQQLEIQKLNTQILQSFLERSAGKDKVFAEAVVAVGEGLQALAEAKNRDRV